MHNIVAFSGWLMRKWFGGTGRGLVRFNQWWTQKVQDEPWEAFFLMILFGLMILLVALLLGAVILHYFGVNLFAAFTIGFQVIWVANYLRIIIVDQYAQFRQEQDQIINRLKGNYR